MIVGILGFAQTGKDTVSDILMKHNFERMAFADELKRVTMRIFDFSYEQMWGTLEEKEAPDYRYPREHSWGPVGPHGCLCCGTSFFPIDGRPQCYLNGRYALKIIGTEGGRHCYSNIWVEKALYNAKSVETMGYYYSKLGGAEPTTEVSPPPKNIIFTDCRFKNEVEGIQQAGGSVYRIRRPGYDRPAFDHPSETEQLQIPDDKLQGVLMNDGTLEDLKTEVLQILERAWPSQNSPST